MKKTQHWPLSLLAATLAFLPLQLQTTPASACETSDVIRHFVAFKYKSGIAPADLKAVEQGFLELKQKIPTVVSIENGKDISTEDKSKGFNEAFLVTFASTKDRDNYLVDPEHKKFLTVLLPKVDDVFVFDFQAKQEKPLFVGGKVVDLTHPIAPGIPDFHGDNNAFQAKQLFTVPKDGFANRAFSMPEHLGTHLDAPSHFVDGGKSIDQISADKLLLPCVVIDVRDEVKNNPDYCLTPEKIEAFEKGGKIPDGACVLLQTGWSTRWSDTAKYRNVDAKGTMHYPAFSKEAAEFLVNQRHAAAIGLDTISLDYGLSTTYPVHHFVLGQGIFGMENLDHLDQLPARGAYIFCGALPMKGGTGSPARILAIVP